MKTFLTFFFLFFTLLSNAQIKKGDLFFGTSVVSYNSNKNKDFNFSQGTLFFSPSFGICVTNNTLVGTRVSTFFSLQKFNNSTNNNSSISAGVFAAQYIGSGKLRGLTDLDISFSSTRTASNLGFGGAYFFNEFSTIELTYNVELFNKLEEEKIDFFTNGIRPVLGLSLKSFLLRDREGIENLTAVNSIVKGTWRGSLAGSLSNLERSKSYFLSTNVSYFLKDYLFLEAGTSLSHSTLNFQQEFRFTNTSASLGIGYYLRLKDNFFGKFSAGIAGNRSRNIQSLLFSSTVVDLFELESSQREAFVNLGLALFFGRHKIEPSLGISFIQDTFKSVDFTSEGKTNFSIDLDYEYFLSQNLSLTGNFNLAPGNDFSTLEVLSISPNSEPDFGIRDDVLSVTNFNAGFNWYF